MTIKIWIFGGIMIIEVCIFTQAGYRIFPLKILATVW